ADDVLEVRNGGGGELDEAARRALPHLDIDSHVARQLSLRGEVLRDARHLLEPEERLSRERLGTDAAIHLRRQASTWRATHLAGTADAINSAMPDLPVVILAGGLGTRLREE